MAFTFPNPNTTTEFTADNGITYSWDPIDGKWVVKGFSDGADPRYVSKTGGDSMQTDLEIKTNPDNGGGFGEAAVTLNGKRDNTNNSCAAVRFKNWNYDNTDEINGYITYYTTDSTHFFRFNQDIRLPVDVNLSFSNGGAIQHNAGNRIVFDTASNGNEGSGLVTFVRPGNSARRGVAFRGNIVDPDDNTQMKEVDLLYTYTNSSGTSDAVNYEGKSSGGNNIVNFKTMEQYIHDLGVNQESYEKITYELLHEGLTIVEGSWSGNAGDGNLKVESFEDVSTHVGWRPDNTGKIYIGQPLKFTHDSGVRYGRVEAVWTNSNTTHLTVGDWVGDPFVDGETTTVEYQLSRFVAKEGDTMTGHLTLHGEPTLDLHAATKSYVDGFRLETKTYNSYLNNPNVSDDTGYKLTYYHVSDNPQAGDTWKDSNINKAADNFGLGFMQRKISNKDGWVCMHEDYLSATIGVDADLIVDFTILNPENLTFGVADYNTTVPSAAGGVWHWSGVAVIPGEANRGIEDFSDLDGLCKKADGTRVNYDEAIKAAHQQSITNFGTSSVWQYTRGRFLRGYLEVDSSGSYDIVLDPTSKMFVTPAQVNSGFANIKFRGLMIPPGTKVIVERQNILKEYIDTQFDFTQYPELS